jgi:hypothetical protein
MKIKQFIKENKVMSVFIGFCILLTIINLAGYAINFFYAPYPVLTSCFSPNSIPYHYTQCHGMGMWTLLDFLVLAVAMIIIPAYIWHKVR